MATGRSLGSAAAANEEGNDGKVDVNEVALTVVSDGLALPFTHQVRSPSLSLSRRPASSLSQLLENPLLTHLPSEPARATEPHGLARGVARRLPGLAARDPAEPARHGPVAAPPGDAARARDRPRARLLLGRAVVPAPAVRRRPRPARRRRRSRRRGGGRRRGGKGARRRRVVRRLCAQARPDPRLCARAPRRRAAVRARAPQDPRRLERHRAPREGRQAEAAARGDRDEADVLGLVALCVALLSFPRLSLSLSLGPPCSRLSRASAARRATDATSTMRAGKGLRKDIHLTSLRALFLSVSAPSSTSPSPSPSSSGAGAIPQSYLDTLRCALGCPVVPLLAHPALVAPAAAGHMWDVQRLPPPGKTRLAGDERGHVGAVGAGCEVKLVGDEGDFEKGRVRGEVRSLYFLSLLSLSLSLPSRLGADAPLALALVARAAPPPRALPPLASRPPAAPPPHRLVPPRPPAVPRGPRGVDRRRAVVQDGHPGRDEHRGDAVARGRPRGGARRGEGGAGVSGASCRAGASEAMTMGVGGRAASGATSLCLGRAREQCDWREQRQDTASRSSELSAHC